MRAVAARGRPGVRVPLALALVSAAAAALVLTYLALGGGEYEPLEVADPCKPRSLGPAEGFEAASQQVVLSALDGAACRLRVTREELALALTSAESRVRFAREHRIDEEELEDAIRSGLTRAVEDAESTGRLAGREATLLRAAVEGLPIGTLLDAVRSPGGLADAIDGFLGR